MEPGPDLWSSDTNQQWDFRWVSLVLILGFSTHQVTRFGWKWCIPIKSIYVTSSGCRREGGGRGAHHAQKQATARTPSKWRRDRENKAPRLQTGQCWSLDDSCCPLYDSDMQNHEADLLSFASPLLYGVLKSETSNTLICSNWGKHAIWVMRR